MAERIGLFPLHTILFPSTDLGLHVFEDRYRTLVSRCLQSGEGFGVVLIRSGTEVGGPADPHAVGTLAKVSGYARLPDGRYLLEVEGSTRFRIESVIAGEQPYMEAEVSWLPEPIGNFASARRHGADAERRFADYRNGSGDGDTPVRLPVDPVARSYVLSSLLKIDAPEKQALLELPSADVRLQRAVEILRREISLLEHVAPGGSEHAPNR